MFEKILNMSKMLPGELLEIAKSTESTSILHICIVLIGRSNDTNKEELLNDLLGLSKVKKNKVNTELILDFLVEIDKRYCNLYIIDSTSNKKSLGYYIITDDSNDLEMICNKYIDKYIKYISDNKNRFRVRDAFKELYELGYEEIEELLFTYSFDDNYSECQDLVFSLLLKVDFDKYKKEVLHTLIVNEGYQYYFDTFKVLVGSNDKIFDNLLTTILRFYFDNYKSYCSMDDYLDLFITRLTNTKSEIVKEILLKSLMVESRSTFNKYNNYIKVDDKLSEVLKGILSYDISCETIDAFSTLLESLHYESSYIWSAKDNDTISIIIDTLLDSKYEKGVKAINSFFSKHENSFLFNKYKDNLK